MAYQATGRLHKVFETEQKSASFAVRDFVIETTDSKFPQLIKFQLTQDKCALIDEFSEGDDITVEFDLRGREWNDKYFTNLNAWRIGLTAMQEGSSGQPTEATTAPTTSFDDMEDDIPF